MKTKIDGSTSADETSPLDRDSDEDGLDDGVEDAKTKEVDFGETDPRTADTDGDGLLDSEDGVSSNALSIARIEGQSGQL